MHFVSGLDNLKERAVKITKSTKFFNPVFQTTESGLNPQAFTPAYSKRFSEKDNIISFIDENMNWYIIPNLKGVVETLKMYGYIKAEFYVPCTENDSYPIHKKEEWEEMLCWV